MNGGKGPWSPADFREFRHQLGSFAYLMAYRESPGAINRERRSPF